ncbi:hypothetical protein J7K44_00265 [bacterium]|nr:hypothetical protein [bacterium]
MKGKLETLRFSGLKVCSNCFWFAPRIKIGEMYYGQICLKRGLYPVGRLHSCPDFTFEEESLKEEDFIFSASKIIRDYFRLVFSLTFNENKMILGTSEFLSILRELAKGTNFPLSRFLKATAVIEAEKKELVPDLIIKRKESSRFLILIP